MKTQQHVVVLGAGYAGLMAAVRLAKKTRPNVAVTLVNAAEAFQERVRHHQRAAGQSVRPLPLAGFLRGTRVRLLTATVTALHPAQRALTVRAGDDSQRVTYDYLLYALGSHVDTAATPGANEHAYTPDEASARALAQRLPELAARGGRVLIVGGGNTGLEVSSELAESHPGLRLTLATRRSFAHNLSPAARAHVRRALQRLGITFLENTPIAEVQAGQALTAGGEALPFDACVWVGGFAVPDLARRAGLAVNARGQILVDRAMRSIARPEIYAVGDAACPVEPPGAPIRMALYTAIMMGAHGADCLAAELNGAAPAAFGLSYVALGLSLGRNDGVFQFLDWDTDRPLRWIVTGRTANLMREFFVRFAVWAIHAQRTAPWVFIWPGKHKLRGRVAAQPPAVLPR